MAESSPPRSGRDLISRLPRTFGPSFNDQLSRWELLFPAEQRQLQAQVDWLSKLPADEFRKLFAPIVELEGKMELPHWEPGAKGFSVTDTGILARSPYYPKWRTEVQKVFARIDNSAGESGSLRPLPRLIVGALPSGIPIGKETLWPDVAKQGTWVALEKPFGQAFSGLVNGVATRTRPDGMMDSESTWIFECESKFLSLSNTPATIVLSWRALAAARREFLNRLNTIRRDLRSVDETNQDLQRMDIGKLLGPAIESRPQVREFVRSLLLSGNGSLVFPNSFVQWGSSEALRRAQPQALVACFGMREKLKPFSSTVLFEDQNRSNPTPDEDDPAGSLVDGMMLAQYVHFAAQRVAPYEGHTLTILAAGDLDRILMLGGPPAPKSRLSAADLNELTIGWLRSGP